MNSRGSQLQQPAQTSCSDKVNRNFNQILSGIFKMVPWYPGHSVAFSSEVFRRTLWKMSNDQEVSGWLNVKPSLTLEDFLTLGQHGWNCCICMCFWRPICLHPVLTIQISSVHTANLPRLGNSLTQSCYNQTLQKVPLLTTVLMLFFPFVHLASCWIIISGLTEK